MGMVSPMSEVTERVTSLVDDFDARVQSTPADAWNNQSPCTDWKARDVVVHVANNLLRMSNMPSENPPSVGADEDIVAAWNSARDGFTKTLAGDLSQEVNGPFGPMPLEQLLGRIIATDVLVHTWDLARAVGGDEKLNDAAVEGAYSGMKPMDAMIRRPGLFDEKTTAPADADTQTEFLCFLGRKV